MLLGEKEVDDGLTAEALVEDEVPRIVPVLMTGRLSFPPGVKSTAYFVSPGCAAAPGQHARQSGDTA